MWTQAPPGTGVDVKLLFESIVTSMRVCVRQRSCEDAVQLVGASIDFQRSRLLEEDLARRRGIDREEDTTRACAVIAIATHREIEGAGRIPVQGGIDVRPIELHVAHVGIGWIAHVGHRGSDIVGFRAVGGVHTQRTKRDLRARTGASGAGRCPSRRRRTRGRGGRRADARRRGRRGSWRRSCSTSSCP